MRPLIAAFLAAAIAASPAAAAKERVAPEERLAKLLEGRVAGEPRDCLPLASIRNTQVIDRTAIVYRVGSTLWVNRPDGGAEWLDGNDVMITRPTGSQLCSVDVVRLSDRSTFFPTGFVSLGEFVPYRRAQGE